MKLGEWSLHFYRLPYVRDIQWVYAAENSGDYVLLKIVADNGAAGIAEGVIKPTRTGYSPRSLAVALEDVILPQLRQVDLTDARAVTTALARIPENALKFAVGLMLTSFGVFWIGEGLGAEWPGADLALLGILALLAISAIALVRWLRGLSSPAAQGTGR